MYIRRIVVVVGKRQIWKGLATMVRMLTISTKNLLGILEFLARV